VPNQQNKTGAEQAPETTASSSQAVAWGPPEVSINKIPYLIAIGFGFLGTLIYTLLGSKKRQEKQEVSLSMLQGMSDYMIYRFNEIGIDDAQNLALADLDFLHENVGYGSRLLCDFVAQAILLVHLREYFAALQAAGIRNVICFRQVVNTTTYKDLATLLKIPAEILLAFLNMLETDQMRERVKALEMRAMQSDHQQSSQPNDGSSIPALASCFSPLKGDAVRAMGQEAGAALPPKGAS
jgi:hypothetical protein